ncbi:hypothetical protein U3516DRAFT_598880 [Neocallimastix sp. 'constans']|jgi:hypothetical protein
MIFKNKYTLLLVLLVVAVCFNFVNAAKKQKLTPEQQALKNKMKAERMKKSEAADKLIRHSTVKEFKDEVLNDEENLWIVFFGSKKCPHTQKFNPKWLQFQQNMDDGLYNFENIKITKIECYGEQFDFCVSQENQYWPELMFYYKGVKKGSYDGEDEIEDIVKYINEKKDSLMKVKSTKNVKPLKSGLPSKKPGKNPPSNKPSTKNPPKKPTKVPAKRPPPPKPVKDLPPPKNEESKDNESDDNEIEEIDVDDNNYENNNSNNGIEEEIDNSIDDKNHEIENGIEEEDYYIPKKGGNVENNEALDQNEGSSHVLVYSIGGCAACVAGLLFAKKRFRGQGYSRIGGNERTAQMRYKYDKHIV